VSKALLFDWPTAYTIIDDAIETYGIDSFSDPAAMPPAEKQMIAKFKQTPYWQGIYEKVVLHFKDPKASWNFDAPLFEKIRQGEVWRLVTPCFLHFDIFHIFFNMIWLIVLGRQIEARLGIARYIIFIVITGVVSNIAQYLMSGPNFIGFSGVVCAMIVFVWVRQKKVPWEGYLLHPSTVMFVGFFVFAILGIQLFSFLMEINGMRSISPAIANTAHLVGGGTGYLLGRTSLFAWR
jgi:GlpG protein